MRSGLRATIFSGLVRTPPSFGRDFASAGKSEKSSVATIRSPAPRANTISLALGANETTPAGAAASVRVFPRSAGAERGPWAAVAGGLPDAAAAPVQARG